MPKAIHPYDVIQQPLMTEIKQAVEKAFEVRVVAVNVMNVRGKQRRWGGRENPSPSWKKAIVTLAAGDKIELFEGV